MKSVELFFNESVTFLFLFLCFRKLCDFFLRGSKEAGDVCFKRKGDSSGKIETSLT